MTKRFWVIGGEYEDPDFRALIPGTETMAGPFEDERKARNDVTRTNLAAPPAPIDQIVGQALALPPMMGLERGLYLYSYDPGAMYSDMNGWGPERCAARVDAIERDRGERRLRGRPR